MPVDTINNARPDRGSTEHGDTDELLPIRPLIDQTQCPFASTARLAAAPRYHGGPLGEYLDRSLNEIINFTRRAEEEHLDAFVLRFPVATIGSDLPALGRMTHTIVKALMRGDPDDPRDVDRDAVLQPRWRLSFAGMDYFLAVFAPVFPPPHNRHTFGIADQIFVLLQPDSSFHVRLGGHPRRVRESIRKRFAQAGQPYDPQHLEAHKFVPPLAIGDPPVRWYDM